MSEALEHINGALWVPLQGTYNVSPCNATTQPTPPPYKAFKPLKKNIKQYNHTAYPYPPLRNLLFSLSWCWVVRTRPVAKFSNTFFGLLITGIRKNMGV